MTDQEVCCMFMETRPELPPYWSDGWPQHAWWLLCKTPGGGMDWLPFPRIFDLDACHRIEARLTDEQWSEYMAMLLPEEFTPPFPLTAFQAVTHADAPAKVAALAVVLRPIVEAKNAL